MHIMRAARASRRWQVAVATLLPVLIQAGLYALVGAVNARRVMHDDALLRVESSWFGDPSRAWARQWPDTTVSTVLHACYLAYYAILLVPYARLALRQEKSAWRMTFRAHMVTLLIGVVIFLLWPVEGPRFRAPIGRDVLPDATHLFTNTLLATFSARGTAFPSSHVSIAVAHLLVAWTTQRALALMMAPVVLGMAIGAVYGGFHYLSDVLAGALLGVLCVLLLRRISKGAAARAAT